MNFKKSSFKGSIPKDSSVRGSSPDEKLHFSLMSKGGRFIRCMDREFDAWRESTEAWFKGERWSQGEIVE